MDKNCIFCKIVNKKVEGEIVKENKDFIALRDSNPVSEGHTLIIPKKHYENLMDMPEKLMGSGLKLAKDVAKDLIDKKLATGFNIVMNNFEAGGQEVFHAHIHVIPRKKADGIRWLTKV